MPKNAVDKRRFTVSGKNFLFAFKRDCKRCGAAIGVLSSKEPVSRCNVNALRKNLEGMFGSGECPYCAAKGRHSIKSYAGTPDVYRKLVSGLYSADSVIYLVNCKTHGHIRIFIKGKKDISFAQIRNGLNARKESSIREIPRAKPQVCPICGQQSKVDMHEVGGISVSPIGGMLDDFKKALSGYAPIKSPLLHLQHPFIRQIASEVFAEAVKPANKANKTPGTDALLAWMSRNIRPGMLKGFKRGKFIRSDLEVLEDREANGIEFCLLFYSIARNLDIDCSFGISDVNVQGIDEILSSIVYLIFAEEGGKEATISPGAMFSGVMMPDTEIQERMDIREFLRRIHMLAKTDIFKVLKSIPLLYHVGKSAAWLYRPAPNQLSFVLTSGKDQLLEFKYIVEADNCRAIKCTLVDSVNKVVLTSSKEDERHFLLKKPKGFQVLFTNENMPILSRARNLLEPEMANIFFAEDMNAVLSVFESRAMKHYDHSYG